MRQQRRTSPSHLYFTLPAWHGTHTNTFLTPLYTRDTFRDIYTSSSYYHYRTSHPTSPPPMVSSTPFSPPRPPPPPPPPLSRPSTTLHPLDHEHEHDEESATATLLRKRDGSADPPLPPLFSPSTITTTASPTPPASSTGPGPATSSSSSSSSSSSTTSNYQDMVFISGAHADFFLWGTKGIGGSDANTQISLALREKRPDILIVQLCSTRLRLLLDPDASIWSYLVDVHAATSSSNSSSSSSSSSSFSPYHPFAGAAPSVLNFSRFASLVIARVVWKALALLVGQRRTLAQEYVHTIRLAAAPPSPAQHTRVVLGDRDLPITLSRAWHLLTFQERVALLAELALLSLPPFLPARTACRLLGLSPPFLPIPRGSDATAEVLHFFSQRHPSLAPLEKEGGDYFMSSLQKLDQPRFGREGEGREGGGAGDRAVVLVVVGASLLPYLQAHWGEVVDRRRLVSLRGGGGGRGRDGGGGGWAWPCVGLAVLVIVSYMLCQAILFLSAPPQKTYGSVRKSNPSMAF